MPARTRSFACRFRRSWTVSGTVSFGRSECAARAGEIRVPGSPTRRRTPSRVRPLSGRFGLPGSRATDRPTEFPSVRPKQRQRLRSRSDRRRRRVPKRVSNALGEYRNPEGRAKARTAAFFRQAAFSGPWTRVLAESRSSRGEITIGRPGTAFRSRPRIARSGSDRARRPTGSIRIRSASASRRPGSSRPRAA